MNFIPSLIMNKLLKFIKKYFIKCLLIQDLLTFFHLKLQAQLPTPDQQKESFEDQSSDAVERAKKKKYSVTVKSNIEAELSNFAIDSSIGPELDFVIQSLLQIKPTSVDSERTFSICRNIMAFNRLRLNPDKLDIIVFVNQNFKKLLKINSSK